MVGPESDADGVIVDGPEDVRVEEGVDVSDDAVECEVVIVDSSCTPPFVEVVSPVWTPLDAAEEVVPEVTPLDDVVEDADELSVPEAV